MLSHHFKFNEVSLKAISKNDMAFLLNLYTTTRWDEVMQAPWTDQQRLDFLTQQFQAQHKHYQKHYPYADYFLIVKDGDSIGRIYLDRDETSICLIDVALLPDYKQKGLGTVLLKELLDEAQETIKKIVLHVEKFNPAYHWYIKHGFNHVEDKGVHQYLEWHPKE